MAEMSYIHKPALRPLEHRTIVQLFDIHANKHPDIEAFIFYTSTGQRSTYTFRQIQQMSLSLAASFLRLGWKRGERVALIVPKQVEFVVNYVALLRLGVNVILVPVYGRPADEVFAHLKRLKCNGYIIHENSVKSFNIRDVLTDLEQVVLIDKERAGISEGEYNYRNLLETGRDLGVDEVLKRQEQVQFEDPAVVVFTSGTTGVPKAVQYTHHAIANSCIQSYIKDPTASGMEGLRMFNDRPFCWLGGLSGILCVMAVGYTLVTAPATKSVKEKDIDFILNILQSEKCAFAVLSYYMVIDMLNCSRLREYDLSSLKYAATTGQHVHTEVLKRLKAILPHSTLILLYGLTEACLGIGKQIILANAVVEDDVAMEILPPFEVRIIDEDRRLVEVGTVGQISVRCPITFLGYLDDADETSKVISSTGWVHTGDTGFIDQRGKLTVSGRRSDMIKRATVKIYPAEIEQMIIKYPEVNDVAVVGVPDVRLYEELCACVIPKPGRTMDAGVFEEWASQQFSVDEQGLSMKPKYTLVMEEFPKTKTSKIDRKALREIAVGKLGIH